MQVKIEPLAPELEAAIREKLAANPFIKFVGITAPQLGKGYARFLLPFKPELANTIGLMQGGVIAALADEAVAYALYSLVADGEMFNTVEMKICLFGDNAIGVCCCFSALYRRAIKLLLFVILSAAKNLSFF